MSQQKQNVLGIGPGGMNQYQAQTASIISSNVTCSLWGSGVTYGDLNIVEYSGSLYRSLQAVNTNQQPDTSPDWWRKEVPAVKDGDICVVVNGNKSDTQQRAGGLWKSLADQPIRVALVDGQLTPAIAFQFNATDLPYAVIDYTIRRGSGHGRKKHGRFTIMNDGSGSMNYSLEYEELGTNVEVTLIPILNAGWIEMQYTSVDNGGVAIELAYDLKGWV